MTKTEKHPSIIAFLGWRPRHKIIALHDDLRFES